MSIEQKEIDSNTKKRHTGYRKRRRKKKPLTELDYVEGDDTASIDTGVGSMNSRGSGNNLSVDVNTSWHGGQHMLINFASPSHSDSFKSIQNAVNSTFDFDMEQYFHLSTEDRNRAHSNWIDTTVHSYEESFLTNNVSRSFRHNLTQVDFDFENVYREQEALEYIEEQQARKRWGKWAAQQAELERARRLKELQEDEDREKAETLARKRWALEAIEAERQARVMSSYLSSLSNTNWFAQVLRDLSKSDDIDYEVVCPHHHRGCTERVFRSNLDQHMEICEFNPYTNDIVASMQTEGGLSDNYEVVCPNTFHGCNHTCSVDDILQHLTTCSYNKLPLRNTTTEDDDLQSEVSSSASTFSTPVSSPRRPDTRRKDTSTTDNSSSSSSDGATEPLSFLERQNSTISTDSLEVNSEKVDREVKANLKGVLYMSLQRQARKAGHRLHDHVKQMWSRNITNMAKHKKSEYKIVMDFLRQTSNAIWPFSKVEVVGSVACNLSGFRLFKENAYGETKTSSDHDKEYDSESSNSGSKVNYMTDKHDIDVVIVFADQVQPFLPPKEALLNTFSKALASTAEAFPFKNTNQCKDISKDDTDIYIQSFTVKKVLQQARIPVIKAEAMVVSAAGQASIHIDICINDSKRNTSLAAASMIKTLLRFLPGMAPVVVLMKEFFKANGVNDAYTGGLGSYGVFLLCLASTLKYLKSDRYKLHKREGTNRHTGDVERDTTATATSSATSTNTSAVQVKNKNKISSKTHRPPVQSTEEKEEEAVGEDALWKRDRAHSDGAISSTTLAANIESQVELSKKLYALYDDRSGHLKVNSEATAASPTKEQQGVKKRTNHTEESQKDSSRVDAGVPLIRRRSGGSMHSEASLSPLRARMLSADAVFSSELPGVYTWNNVMDEKRLGQEVALQTLKRPIERLYGRRTQTDVDLLLQPDLGDFGECAKLFADTSPLDDLDLVIAPMHDIVLQQAPDGNENYLSIGIPSSSSAHLEKHKVSLLPIESPLYGDLIEEFLKQYGEEFVVGQHGFSVRDGGFRFKIQSGEETPLKIEAMGESEPVESLNTDGEVMLVVEDPLDGINNVAKSCYKGMMIQRLLNTALERFRMATIRQHFQRDVRPVGPLVTGMAANVSEGNNNKEEGEKTVVRDDLLAQMFLLSADT